MTNIEHHRIEVIGQADEKQFFELCFAEKILAALAEEPGERTLGFAKECKSSFDLRVNLAVDCRSNFALEIHVAFDTPSG